MAGHLMDAGHALTVYSRTREKAAPLLDRGASWAENPAAVAANCDILFSMVGFPEDVESIYLGDRGVLASEQVPGICVDLTTTRPSLVLKIHDRLDRHGSTLIDAPVSGGWIGAKEGVLAIMAGGERAAFDKVLPLLKTFGRDIEWMGPIGSGQHTKMCNQILAAGTMIGVCESLLYAEKAGLNREEVIGIVSRGAAACWSIQKLGPKIVEGDYSPGFYVEHFIKDLGIALEESKALGLSLPGTALAYELYERTSALGRGRDGTQALIEAIRDLSDGSDGSA